MKGLRVSDNYGRESVGGGGGDDAASERSLVDSTSNYEEQTIGESASRDPGDRDSVIEEETPTAAATTPLLLQDESGHEVNDGAVQKTGAKVSCI